MLKNFNAVRITIASPAEIREWSHGEVTKAETINYRTYRSEPQGLMAEEIFGPTKDFECYCGKYKKIRYKGIVCDRCGVEVTHKRVRRERMGHIELATPIAHLWFSNGIPNRLAMILDIPQKKLQTVIYYARYVVTSVNEEEKAKALESIPDIKQNEFTNIDAEEQHRIDEITKEFKNQREDAQKENAKNDKKLNLQLERIANNEKKEVAKIKSAYNQRRDSVDSKFNEIKGLITTMSKGATLSEEEHSLLEEFELFFYESGMGAEAIKMLLDQLNIDTEIDELQGLLKTSKSLIKKAKIVQRLRTLKGLKNSGVNPSWLILEVLPVIPPDLRPIIQLPGGRFATYDLNDLYRRVINRNNRLKRLINLGAPEIILRNEKRMLQQSVDALLDNNHMPSAPALNTRQMPYKSLSDNLRGKTGRFRQNLLGKRVDYSGRAVIVAGPELKFDQCGLPKNVALELFKPFIIRELIGRGFAANPTRAKIIFEQKGEEVWDILEEVSKDRPVLLNRAPSLHRYSILAFYPILIEGNAIRLHPMVVTGFNADFDGDQMAVHLPLSDKAVTEVKARMFAKDNMLHMRNSEPIINVQKDMAMGIYYMTLMKGAEAAHAYSTKDEALAAYELGNIKFYEPIKVVINGSLMTTTAGRILFNSIIPESYSFINYELDKAEIAKVSSSIFNDFGGEIATQFLDKVKDFGFKLSGELGWSISMQDFRFGGSEIAAEAIAEFDKIENSLYESFSEGMMTSSELETIRMDEWDKATNSLQTKVWELAGQSSESQNLMELERSGGVPVKSWLKQIAGVRGSVTNMDGKFVNLPLKGNYEHGLDNFEYFAASKAVRKSMADVALKTANSGYLTRRLVDVAQDIVSKLDDCGSSHGITISKSDESTRSFGDRIRGRFAAKDIVNTKTGEVIVKASDVITFEMSEQLNSNADVTTAYVRSPLTCLVPHGICTKCYGFDNTTRQPIAIGEAVGISAAQALGEPTTQLTLKSKSDARAGKTDVTQGLPRVEELLEVRAPKGMAVLSDISGKVQIIDDKKKVVMRVSSVVDVIKSIEYTESDEILVKDKSKVKVNDIVLVKADKTEIRTPFAGKISVNKEKSLLYIQTTKQKEFEYKIDDVSTILVQDGEDVVKGQQLTSGSKDPKQIASLISILDAQQYIVNEVQKVYSIQGLDVDDRHLEVIARQMGRYVLIKDQGDSEDFLPGDFADRLIIQRDNYTLKSQDKRPIKYDNVMLGVTNASIRTESFLSAASFEQQVRVLTEAALIGKVDHLRGLKENVIIGRPVPLGGELWEHNAEELDEAKATVEILQKVQQELS